MSIPVMTMMVGLVASGKSTYAERLARETDAIILSSDAIRWELFGDETDQDHNQKVFQELHKRAKEWLCDGRNVIYDATNISSKRRRAFLSELTKIDCIKNCVIIATPYGRCLYNNSKRTRIVPEYAIKNMYLKWQTPALFEGWDSIECINNYDTHYIDPIQVADSLICYDQHNTHHALTLGEHMIKTADIVSSNDDCNVNIFAAALTHDMGKPMVQTVDWDKQTMHYYSHEHVSAYETLFIDKHSLEDVDPLKVSALVTWHMQPYFYEWNDNVKLQHKYMKIWGDKFYRELILLHEADKSAH